MIWSSEYNLVLLLKTRKTNGEVQEDQSEPADETFYNSVRVKLTDIINNHEKYKTSKINFMACKTNWNFVYLCLAIVTVIIIIVFLLNFFKEKWLALKQADVR